ncbi:MAG: hypothetical protein RIE73_05530 [Coleofasciculus sp. C1-SOL-03]|jgi:hypothetical protein|uniref:hypothetical protein n=1 Tax=Coleofasciculus sp. C1-SOL-03 TaxID=3069522 RepID=UPI00330185DB
MNQNYSTLSVAVPSDSQPLANIKTNFGSDDCLRYEFEIRGVGRGTFSYSDHSLVGNSTKSVLLESLVWNGNSINLSNFQERSVCLEQGELLGLNLLGEGWEIFLNLSIQINGVHWITEVNYRPIKKSVSVDR